MFAIAAAADRPALAGAAWLDATLARRPSAGRSAPCTEDSATVRRPATIPCQPVSATSRTLLVVNDPERVVWQAVAAGATETSPVGDEHGWRLGRIVDPFGHEWEIGAPPGTWPTN
jgi:hypothetical protein